jgi:glycosyltransferase involved in cell wall biosynthesis
VEIAPIKVVHLTAHMSGGLARVLLSTLKYAGRCTPGISHEIVTLGDITAGTREAFAVFQDRLFVNKSRDFIATKLAGADVVQVEYWNHPLLYAFLLQFEFPPARIVACCHVAGLYRPQVIRDSVVAFSDLFVAATQATAGHTLFRAPAPNPAREKLRFMPFPVDVDRFPVRRPERREGFRVGYVGTVGYSKLHPGFLRMCANVRAGDATFVVCGEDADGIEAEAKRLAPSLFEFIPYQEDVSPVLRGIDVFGYPLNATHFGSGEQALVEAMYFGIPVVAFANPAESEIVEHNVTGLLAGSEREYVEAIDYLYANPSERTRLGENARRFVETHLVPGVCFPYLEGFYRELMPNPKRVRSYSGSVAPASLSDPVLPDFGARALIESLGCEGAEFYESLQGGDGSATVEADAKIAAIEPAMKTRTKGSLYQYLYFFPNDPYLNLWAGLVARKEGRLADADLHFRKAPAGRSPGHRFP